MAFNIHAWFPTLSFPLLLLLAVSSSPAGGAVPPPPATNNIPPTTACKDTPDPGFCRSVIAGNGSSTNMYEYGRFSINRSLSTANRFSRLIDQYLRRSSSYSIGTVRALQDCKLLADLNLDFLSDTFSMINSTTTLVTMEADDVQTLLSAIVTNQQTCLEGLQTVSSASSVENGLSTTIFNGTRLYRVSLALVTQAWIPRKQKKTGRQTRQNERVLFSGTEMVKQGRLALRMSSRNREIFETGSGRKLLQTSDSVLVRDVVVVSQDGSGNFSTINDAIAAAPNKTKNEDGYFLIFIRAGVYEEYVSIAKNKKNLMIIGDGINQTIITGNRSVVDGWTTFNSATFGK